MHPGRHAFLTLAVVRRRSVAISWLTRSATWQERRLQLARGRLEQHVPTHDRLLRSSMSLAFRQASSSFTPSYEFYFNTTLRRLLATGDSTCVVCPSSLQHEARSHMPRSGPHCGPQGGLRTFAFATSLLLARCLPLARDARHSDFAMCTNLFWSRGKCKMFFPAAAIE